MAAEKFEYPVTGTVTDSWLPSINSDSNQLMEATIDGVAYEARGSGGQHRYNESTRTSSRRLVFGQMTLTDKNNFATFKTTVGSNSFRYTNADGVVRKVTFSADTIIYTGPDASDLYSWSCVLLEAAPAPGLDRSPAALRADLMYYLRGQRGVTAYGRDTVTANFSRPSTATFIDAADGLLKTAGNNVPRFEAAGLLLEGARTNLCLQSEDFSNASWTKSNITVAANDNAADGADPRNTSTADLLTATAGNATALQTFTISSASKVFSIWLKRKTGTGNIDLTVDNGSTWTTKSISSTAWTRVNIVQIVANPVIGIRIVTSGDAIWAWGAQLEDGVTFLSSYIPTTSASVARSADALSYPASGNLTAATGSAMVVFTPAGIDNAVAQTPLSIDDGTANERIQLTTSTSSALRPRATVDDGGVSQANITATASADDFAVNTAKSVGITWAVNDVHLYSTGVDRGNDASATMPSPTTIRVGSTVSGADPIFGWVRDLAIFGRVLTSGEMLTVHNALIAA